jgi:hypothetical protein
MLNYHSPFAFFFRLLIDHQALYDEPVRSTLQKFMVVQQMQSGMTYVIVSLSRRQRLSVSVFNLTLKVPVSMMIK